jgi:hypothetical protein
MGALRCVDGSVLSVEPVSCRDRTGQPYEITLNLARNSTPFAAVGQRCGYQLAQLAERLTAARQDPGLAAAWPDPDDRFPAAADHEAAAALPAGDHEYFALRSRDRADLPGTGELRCVLRSSAEWLGECTGTGQHVPGPHLAGPHLAGPHVPGPHLPGQRPGSELRPAAHPGTWRLTRRAVIEAWGEGGIGVRAVLTSAELVAFLDTVLEETESAEASGSAGSCTGSVSASVRGTDMPAGQSAGKRPVSGTTPLWRQRGRVPDGIARSRLPALRAQARIDSGAAGDTPSRRGDVRR